MKKNIFLLIVITLVAVHATSSAQTMNLDGTTNMAAPSQNTFDSGQSFGQVQDTSGGFGTGGIGGTAGGGGGIGGMAGGSGSAGLQDPGKPQQSIYGFTVWIVKMINNVIYVLMAAALLFFLYGIFVLMFVDAGNEESRSKGKRFMLWGIISLFVMVSVWGLVGVLNASFFGGSTQLRGPEFKTVQ